MRSRRRNPFDGEAVNPGGTCLTPRAGADRPGDRGGAAGNRDRDLVRARRRDPDRPIPTASCTPCAGCGTQPDQGYRFLSSVHAADYLPATPRFAVHYELLCRERVERMQRQGAARGSGGRRRSNAATAGEASRARLLRRPLPDRRVSGARGLRLLRNRLPRPPRSAADRDARGLRRLAAAPRLPDRAASRCSTPTTRSKPRAGSSDGGRDAQRRGGRHRARG